MVCHYVDESTGTYFFFAIMFMKTQLVTESRVPILRPCEEKAKVRNSLFSSEGVPVLGAAPGSIGYRRRRCSGEPAPPSLSRHDQNDGDVKSLPRLYTIDFLRLLSPTAVAPKGQRYTQMETSAVFQENLLRPSPWRIIEHRGTTKPVPARYAAIRLCDAENF
jgi:hypothetical protein